MMNQNPNPKNSVDSLGNTPASPGGDIHLSDTERDELWTAIKAHPEKDSSLKDEAFLSKGGAASKETPTHELLEERFKDLTVEEKEHLYWLESVTPILESAIDDIQKELEHIGSKNQNYAKLLESKEKLIQELMIFKKNKESLTKKAIRFLKQKNEEDQRTAKEKLVKDIAVLRDTTVQEWELGGTIKQEETPLTVDGWQGDVDTEYQIQMLRAKYKDTQKLVEKIPPEEEVLQ